MSKKSRTKGRQGESAAKMLLKDRDWIIIADCTSGIDTADLIAEKSFVGIYCIEVKCRKLINMPEFRKQARQNAKKIKKKWMLMVKIEGSSSWLVEMQDHPKNYITIWHDKKD